MVKVIRIIFMVSLFIAISASALKAEEQPEAGLPNETEKSIDEIMVESPAAPSGDMESAPEDAVLNPEQAIESPVQNAEIWRSQISQGP